jgi:hypothetical protein
VIKLTHTETTTRHAVAGAPTLVAREAQDLADREEIAVDELHVTAYPDGGLSVTVFGNRLDYFGDVTTRRSNASWLQGERFAKGISSGLKSLAAAPEWVRELVDQVVDR